MDDLRAIERIRRGDAAGLAALVERYQARAVRAAYAVTQDRSLAEDVVQTVFVQLFRTLHTFDLQRPFAPWFFKSVVNAAVKAARRDQQMVSLNTVSDDGSEETFAALLPDMADLPNEQVESEETRAVVRAALAKLTPEQRAVIVMRYYLDMPTSEISAELACPPATVRWRLHAALKHLRGLLAVNEIRG